MPRIEPLKPSELPPEAQSVLQYAEQTMGFVANDVLTMARWPELLGAMQPIVGVIYGPGQIDDGLKRLIAMMVSAAAGCRYCQAHTAHGAAQIPGVAAEKVAALWEFETSPLFDERERAALVVALGAGQHPNGVTDEQFATLRVYFGEREILEIVGVIALFGFLNRWNDTLATSLENVPLAFASEALPADRWTPGKHAPTE